MFYRCCDGNQSHTQTPFCFSTSRSNKYAGWREKKKSGLKSSTRGPFTRLPDCWLGPVRVSLGVVYRKMLCVLHTHTYTHTGCNGCRENSPQPPQSPNYPPLCSHRQSASPSREMSGGEKSEDRAAFMEDGFQRHGLGGSSRPSLPPPGRPSRAVTPRPFHTDAKIKGQA